jgi:hypothetical protein
MIDSVISIVVGLVRAPIVLAGRRKLQRSDGVGRQVPEPVSLADASVGMKARTQMTRAITLAIILFLPKYCGSILYSSTRAEPGMLLVPLAGAAMRRLLEPVRF